LLEELKVMTNVPCSLLEMLSRANARHDYSSRTCIALKGALNNCQHCDDAKTSPHFK